MEAKRIELHEILVELLGSRNVYFQRPPNTQMKFPCIIYRRNDVDTHFAGNRPYSQTTRYEVTVVDPDPDQLIASKVGRLPLSSFNRFFVNDNLNHDVYNVFY